MAISGLFSDRTWKVELPRMHYALGAIAGALLVYAHLSGVSHHHSQYYSFFVYFAAGGAMHHDPRLLYDSQFYMPPYIPLRNDGEALVFVNPPPFALLLYLLTFFGYPVAYALWCSLNVLCSVLLVKRIGMLADAAGLDKPKALLMSLMVGTFSWSQILADGQVSIIMALAILSAVLQWRAGKYAVAGGWLALAFCIKPQLPLPLLFFFAGSRHYRLLAAFVVCTLVLCLLSLCCIGPGGWMDFIHHITSVSQNARSNGSDYFRMVNLRGLLSATLPEEYHKAISTLSLVTYLLACAWAFLGGLSCAGGRISWDRALALVLTTGCFFSPWLHNHDAYVLLIAAVPVAAGFERRGQLGWLVVPYVIYVFLWPIASAAQRLLVFMLLYSAVHLAYGRRGTISAPQTR